MTQKLVVWFVQEVRRKYSRLPADEQDAIISDALLALDRRDREEPIQSPEAWLLEAARRLSLNAFRRVGQHEQCTQQLRARHLPSQRRNGEPMATCSPPLSQPVIDLAKSATWKALPKEHIDLLTLVHVGEYSVTDAARQEGVSRSTAKSRLSRARNRLRRDPQMQTLAGVRRDEEECIR